MLGHLKMHGAVEKNIGKSVQISLKYEMPNIYEHACF